jgi:hypothetical protein
LTSGNTEDNLTAFTGGLSKFELARDAPIIENND